MQPWRRKLNEHLGFEERSEESRPHASLCRWGPIPRGLYRRPRTAWCRLLGLGEDSGDLFCGCAQPRWRDRSLISSGSSSRLARRNIGFESLACQINLDSSILFCTPHCAATRSSSTRRRRWFMPPRLCGVQHVMPR